jgi:hypothetical protein
MAKMVVRMAIAASLATVVSGQAAHGWRDQCDKPLIVPGDVNGWETGACTPGGRAIRDYAMLLEVLTYFCFCM